MAQPEIQLVVQDGIEAVRTSVLFTSSETQAGVYAIRDNIQSAAAQTHVGLSGIRNDIAVATQNTGAGLIAIRNSIQDIRMEILATRTDIVSILHVVESTNAELQGVRVRLVQYLEFSVSCHGTGPVAAKFKRLVAHESTSASHCLH